MIFICLCLILLFIFIFLKAGKEEVPEEWVKTKYHKKLFQVSFFIYQIALFVREKYLGKQIKESKKQRIIKEELQRLEPAKEIEKIKIKYNLEKINLCILILVIGIFVITCSTLSSYGSSIIINGNSIERKSYGKGNLNTTLIARVEDETIRKEEIKLLINERKYTDKELETLYEKLKNQLETDILGANLSLNQISSNMKLPSYVSGYPFRIIWECSNYSILNPDGTLGEREAENDGEEVLITANISYFDWKKRCQYKLVVYPVTKTEVEKWKETLMEDISCQDKKTETREYMSLPTNVNGKKIIWKEQKEGNMLFLIILLIVVIMALCIGKDQDLHKKVEERNKEMMQDYPEIVGKMTLLFGSGMSIRSAWKKIAYDYLLRAKKQKRYAYEEMLITCREMDSGISEASSYNNFAKRCRIQSYLKLGTLLSQNLKKGSSNIQHLLQNESKLAFEERKTAAKKLGEEAGTKLLVPMMLMFAIVMIVVIVPAFLSFSI